MRTKVEKELLRSATAAFENACFMYPVPELKEVQRTFTVEAAAEIKYRGSFTGRLVIETSGGLYSAIAVNMLGTGDITGEQKRDALGEMANIICGNVIPALVGGGSEYSIESPRMLDTSELRNNKLGEPLVQVVLNLDKGRADLKFYVNGYYPSKEKKVD